MFEEFCVPYDHELYELFGSGLPDGRGMHMCGNSAHLLHSLVEELAISSFNLFGCAVSPDTVARSMRGRVRLWGNIDPLLLSTGTADEVLDAATTALETLAPCGGYMLGDGANICPGTPAEKLALLIQAAREYGQPLLQSRVNG